MSKETYIKQKRLMERDLHYKNVKRDLHKAKETHGERPTSQKYIQTYTKATYLTPTNMSKETYIKQKRLMERDLHYKNTFRPIPSSISYSMFDVCGMGWLRLVGSFKLQVSFAEYRLFCRALLQQRPILLRSLLLVATP